MSVTTTKDGASQPTPARQDLLQTLVATLRQGQAAWFSGYFAGVQRAAAWIDSIVATLAQDSAAVGAAMQQAASPPLVAAAPALPVLDRSRSLPAPVRDTIPLTAPGSGKETRPVERSLAGAGLTCEPGDALAVLPQNDPAAVEAILDCLSLSGDAPVTVNGRATTLAAALAADYEVCAATPRLIDRWAAISGAAELEALRGEAQAVARAAFLRRHVIDILRRFPVPGVAPQALLAALRPLQPRLCSIASSQALLPDEVHLTVARLGYELHGGSRSTVASGHPASRAVPDALVPVHGQANPHFRLPANDAPLLMTGAATGVAPCRAFLQEREARGAGGRSSRDAGSGQPSGRRYVQHRLREQARGVYAWLQDGAHVHFCGDASGLAPGVHAALLDILQQEAGIGPDAAADYLANLRQDRCCQFDVY